MSLLNIVGIIFFSIASAQSLLDIGTLRPDLSNFFSHVNQSAILTQQFGLANDFTLFVPTNDAFSTWLSSLSSDSSSGIVEATIQYHLQRGTHSTTSLNTNGTILTSYLENSTFVNITQGQRVKAFNDGTVYIESWLKQNSTVISADFPIDGGLIHIVDRVFQIPQDSFAALPGANISDAVTLLSSGHFLDIMSLPLLKSIAIRPGVTVFMPNSSLALSNFKTTGRSQFSLDRQLLYHCADQLLFGEDLVNGTVLTTLAGETSLVTTDEIGQIYVNSARVTATDFLINNGVMHILDDVLNPDNRTLHMNTLQVLPTTTIVGISAGAVTLVLLIVAIIIATIRLRKRRQLVIELQKQIDTTVSPSAENSAWISYKMQEGMVELESTESIIYEKDFDLKDHKDTQTWTRNQGLVEINTMGPVEMPAEVPWRRMAEEKEFI